MSGFQDPRIWDYIAVNAKNEIEAGGWYNSFDGSAFSEEEMEQYVENTYQKLEPFLSSVSGTAVEIGCASGLTMFRMAPYFQRYIGTDMARINLNKNEKVIRSRNIRNIELVQCRANEIQHLPAIDPEKCLGTLYEGDLPRPQFDGAELVIMNSVCQYFPDLEYLDDVILQALKILKKGGIFYIGDVLDEEKLPDFKKELREYQAANPKKKVNVARAGELWIPKSYFLKRKDLDPIKDVVVSDKIFHIENELTKYRYDVLIKKGG